MNIDILSLIIRINLVFISIIIIPTIVIMFISFYSKVVKRIFNILGFAIIINLFSAFICFAFLLLTL